MWALGHIVLLIMPMSLHDLAQADGKSSRQTAFGLNSSQKKFCDLPARSGTPVNARCADPGHMGIQLGKLLAALPFLDIVQLPKQPPSKLIHKRH